MKLPACLLFATASLFSSTGFAAGKSSQKDYGFDPGRFCATVDRVQSKQSRLFNYFSNPSVYIWMRPYDYWSKTTLTVSFLDHSTVEERVKAAASEWSACCGIVFKFVEPGTSTADIRISFKGRSNWSNISYWPLTPEVGKPTMNLHLGISSSDAEVRRVALHEFGHALGFGHEHQYPGLKIKWKSEQAVINFFRDEYGMSDQATRSNVLNRTNLTHFRGSPFDKTSIMVYPIPNDLTADDFETKWNEELSALDKAFALEIYPKPKT